MKIGRDTPFGNPYQGDGCLVLYEQWLRRKLQTDGLFKMHFEWAMSQSELLVCPGCGVDNPKCHGRIMEKVYMKISERDLSIKAAGITQAVIASGAPADEWVGRSLFAMRVSIYLAARMQGKKPVRPSCRGVRFKETIDAN